MVTVTKWEYDPEDSTWEFYTFHEPLQEMALTGVVYIHPDTNAPAFQNIYTETGWVAFTANEILEIHTKMKELENNNGT